MTKRLTVPTQFIGRTPSDEESELASGIQQVTVLAPFRGFYMNIYERRHDKESTVFVPSEASSFQYTQYPRLHD